MYLDYLERIVRVAQLDIKVCRLAGNKRGNSPRTRYCQAIRVANA